MRVRHLIVGGLALLLGACSGGGGGGGASAPPHPKKELLVGTWKNQEPDMKFIQGYEFAPDGAVKMRVQRMEEPVPGRYSWNEDGTLSVEYQPSPEARKAYQAAAKAYKDDINGRIKAGKLYERAGPSLIGAVQDELPDKETFHVGLSDKSNPPMLILNNDRGVQETFEREK